MKMWLFRSNLRALESYHSINDLETFKNECHDFYLLQLIWLLENDYLVDVIVWRLMPKDKEIWMRNKHWKIGKNKWFSQCWVKDFSECLEQKLETDISFFRGGFKEYDILTKHKNQKRLGKKLYLGAGQRTYPQYGGKYDAILVEENNTKKDTVPFYKTASPKIFYRREPVADNVYDICFISNFTQLRYKGQEQFIKQISNSEYLRSLKIIHLGNKPEEGTKLCHKYDVYNIQFLGWLDRNKTNDILNQSKFGLVYSNRLDGTPRVITEVLSSRTPLFIFNETRLLDYYKTVGVLEFNNNNFESIVKRGMNDFENIKNQLNKSIDRISMKKICELNWKNWTKK